MQRWEYTSVWFDDLTRRWTSTYVAEPTDRLVDLFNELGRLGWELCAPILTNEASDTSLTVHLKHDGYVFKRPTR
jgi:hypothetical protein